MTFDAEGGDGPGLGEMAEFAGQTASGEEVRYGMVPSSDLRLASHPDVPK